MRYFNDCKTIEEIKKEYRKLALKFHPDRGGSTEIMQLINNEYSFKIAKTAANETAANEEVKTAEDFQRIINELINLENIIIDIVGSWIWVYGDTKPHKEILKKCGLFWAGKKEKWYYRPKNSKGGRGKKSYEEIINTYGVKTVSKQSNKNNRLKKAI
jgi:hypothetical protein